MAEFVQQSIEEMLPELEQMERVGMFTAAETRAILKKRKAFEYKLRRQTKEKADYLQYVQYEINVLALVKKRRERIGYNFKKFDIDFTIVHRIHKLLNMVSFRFQDDVKLWLTHIDFCKKRGERPIISKLFMRMLQVHNRKPALWIMGAKWEMEDNLSMDNARLLLQQGLRFNKESKHLWKEYFRMELLNADKLRKRREILGLAGVERDEEAVPNTVYDGKVAEIVHCKAMDLFPDDVKFGLSFVSICGLFDFCKSLRDSIMQHLETRFSNNELYLDALARQHFDEADAASSKLSKKEKDILCLEKESQAWMQYEKAIKTAPSGVMWNLYMDACVERLSLKAGSSLCENRLGQTLDVFQRSADEGHMDQSHFLTWIEVLEKTGQPTKASEVVREATTRHPKSVTIWNKCLLLTCLQTTDRDTVLSLLDQAVGKISSKESLQLWETVISWCLLNAQQFVTDVFEKAVLQCDRAEIKEHYLDYAGQTQKSNSIHKLFTRLSASKPHSLDVFRKFIEIELSQASPKIVKLRIAYEAAISEYGKESVELWLDYMKMEREHPRGQAENVSTLHWRAMRTLDSSLTEQFVTQYSLQQNGIIQ